MKTLDEIIEVIKDKICHQKKGPVFDVDVAKALGLTATNLRVRKSRGSIPIEEICIFCEKRNININNMLFEGK